MKVNLEIGKQYQEITGESADAFAEELMKLEDGDFQEVTLDFEGTELISSMAMGSLFSAHMKFSEQGRSLSVINVGDKVLRLLTMVGLDHLVKKEG